MSRMATLKYKIKAEEVGRRIDYIVQKLTERSKSQVRGLFDHNCVSHNQQSCNDAGVLLMMDDEITIQYDQSQNYKEKSRAYQSSIFSLVFEDEHLLIIDKKAGFLTVPNDHRDSQTVVSALSEYLSHGQKKRRMVSIVHRLDRDTSGLLVFAKNDKVAQQIKAQFEKRKPQREYLAIVAGHLKSPKGTFQNFLTTDKNLNQHSTDDEGEGKLAITHYQTKQVLKDTTYVSVTLETGRRNQIRVHFAEIGHPVLGDVRYETARAHHARWKAKRLALHAALLGFTHPVTGKELLFRSKTPVEFEVFVKGQG